MSIETKSVVSEKRDEIVRQAFDVFYQQGFHAAGIVSLLEGSGISKRTLYKYFDSKEALIEATIEYYHDFIFKRILDFIETANVKNPVSKALLCFDWLEEVAKSGHTSGCYAMNAKVEYTDKEKEIVAATQRYFLVTEELLTQLCKEAGCKEAKKVGRQVILLFRGAIVSTQGSTDTSIAALAKSAAKILIEHAIQ